MVLHQIMKGPELVYLCRPGECHGCVGNQKVCLNITVTFSVGSHLNEASMPVQGPRMLVQPIFSYIPRD